ncbi:hypothetical protein GDO86_013720 [Hymenochirus boettgeri]|uniref:Uncharacterized protein n=1 Tax=Hymenochirus boettgeri TaxID=247094 RepID=A0A8T2JQW3_9PIPI|nr:hypothetical protein GDO86_013720 [Hymenochirus boettgeri]
MGRGYSGNGSVHAASWDRLSDYQMAELLHFRAQRWICSTLYFKDTGIYSPSPYRAWGEIRPIRSFSLNLIKNQLSGKSSGIVNTEYLTPWAPTHRIGTGTEVILHTHYMSN